MYFNTLLFLVCFLTRIISPVNSYKLISEIVGFYEQFLNKHGKSNVDVEGLKLLIDTFDEQNICSRECENYLRDLIGSDEMTWYAFEKLVNAIYGDQISDDPFQPQEVHLSFANDATVMKAMFVTMDLLEKPFVEYYVNSTQSWQSSKLVSATSSTYNVPKKWWPIFTGFIYEADMTDLQPDTAYTYRVGGYNTVEKKSQYSGVFTFKSKPLNNPNRKTVITSLADHGTFMLFGFVTINKLVRLKDEINMDFVFVAGDLSYAGLDFDFPPLNIEKTDEVRSLLLNMAPTVTLFLLTL
jgi:hypothetical protein